MKKVSSSWNRPFVTQLYAVLGLQIVVLLKIQCFSNYKKTGNFSVSMPYLMSFTIFRSQKYQSKITGQSRPFCLFCFGIEPQWAQLTGVYPKLQISQSPWPLVLCSYLLRHWSGHEPKLKNGYNYTNLIKRTNHSKWSKLITLQRPR